MEHYEAVEEVYKVPKEEQPGFKAEEGGQVVVDPGVLQVGVLQGCKVAGQQVVTKMLGELPRYQAIDGQGEVNVDNYNQEDAG